MANIFTSSIGKKLIMSITGLFLILFLTLHMSLNLTYVFDPDTVVFQGVCDFMSLGIISIMVPVLAAGFILHIIYAFYLSLTNLKSAGGLNRYAVANKTKTDSWASKNMIYLGIIVLVGIALHLTDFWAKMQLQEWMGDEAGNPYDLMHNTFSSVGITILYLVWFAGLWLHLTHGFWSAIQTIGWNNKIWLKRWKVISYIVATILCGGFAIIAIVACCKAHGIL